MTQNNNSKHGKRIIVRVDPDIVDMIPEFLENRRKDIKSIREALGQEDYEIINELGHRLRGVGKSYGFGAITDIGKSIENAASSKNSKEIQKSICRLLNYIDHVKVVCR